MKKRAKPCVTCGVVKPLSEYSPNKRRKDGRQSRCKPCNSTYASQNRRQSLDHWLAYLVSKSRVRSRAKGLDHTLDEAWIAKAQKKPFCALTGVEFELSHSDNWHIHPLSPSIDRVNSDEGYTPDNVRVVCSWVNTAKSDLSEEHFKLMIGYTAEAIYGVTLIH